MLRKIILPLLALAGAAFTVYAIIQGGKAPPPVPPAAGVPQSPYRSFVAASGLVEAGTENIEIGAPIGGIVATVFVRIGDDVKAGDPLFRIDDRSLRAEVGTRRAAIQVAEAQAAEAGYEFTQVQALAAGGVASEADLQQKRFAAQKADAQLAQARAELNASETDLERLTVRAPVDGQVMQLKVHPGEYATSAAVSSGQTPLILLGSVSAPHVRVDVDESDAWRVPAGASAVGYLRGHKEIKTPLKFVRFEPYVVPKKSMTGDSAERTDTRVLQVIFSFEREDLPIFIGQQMDVFIDAPPRTEPHP